MNIIFGKTQRGASEVNCAEAPDQAELISGKGAHRMRHHGNQSRRSHAERHHIRQRIHLDSMQARRIQQTRGIPVKRIKYHCKQNHARTERKDFLNSVGTIAVHHLLINLKRIENCRKSAQGIAKRQSIRNPFDPTVAFDQVLEMLFHFTAIVMIGEKLTFSGQVQTPFPVLRRIWQSRSSRRTHGRQR